MFKKGASICVGILAIILAGLVWEGYSRQRQVEGFRVLLVEWDTRLSKGQTMAECIEWESKVVSYARLHQTVAKDEWLMIHLGYIEEQCQSLRAWQKFKLDYSIKHIRRLPLHAMDDFLSPVVDALRTTIQWTIAAAER